MKTTPMYSTQAQPMAERIEEPKATTEPIKRQQYMCADCMQVTATFDPSDPADAKRADEASWRHSCREQKRRNRAASRKGGR